MRNWTPPTVAQDTALSAYRVYTVKFKLFPYVTNPRGTCNDINVCAGIISIASILAKAWARPTIRLWGVFPYLYMSTQPIACWVRGSWCPESVEKGGD